MTQNYVLEDSTKKFIDALAAKGGKPIYRLTPAEARGVLDHLQSQPVAKPEVKIEDLHIPGGPKGQISIRIFRPVQSSEKLPVIMYYHGAGWVMGSTVTHDRLVREICVGSNAAVVFVNFSRSPEAQFPIANEEAYAAAKYISEQGSKHHLDASRLAVAGDSVGGNMSIAVTLLAKERRGPKIAFQALFYPVTDAELSSGSYRQFADGPWLTKPAMEWFWNAYEPNPAERKKPLQSPLKASLDQLHGLPPALIVTAENDVLRDEGEAYAHQLMKAGVSTTAVRFLGTIHDFVMLNPLSATPAARGAISLANTSLRQALHGSG